MPEKTDTIIIGAGQSGLSLSYLLAQQNRPHLLLEQAMKLAEPWRNHRWDSFTLVTPNWHIRLPGGEYHGPDPDGFMPRAGVVRYLEGYAAGFNAPLRLGVRVTAVDPGDSGYRLLTSQGEFHAANVVVAAGIFQHPRIPPLSANLPAGLNQLHSGDYRNPEQLPPGAVLVVGGAQSGCQIAEELYQSGRKVYLSLGGSSGRAPRRYRGQDVVRWLTQMGFFDQTLEELKSPEEKFGTNPQISGKNGGHTLNVHQFARDGVTLLGRITGTEGGTATFAPDLKESLEKIDRFETRIVAAIDGFIQRNQIDAPVETLPQLADGYAAKIITGLDLAAAGVTSLVWAMGYSHDFSWIHLPVLDHHGYPIHQGGATAFPGFFFLGLPWQTTRKSAGFFGAAEDAAIIAERLPKY